MANTNNPLVVQNDRTILIEVDHPRYEAARDALAGFAEIISSPEHFHTYRISPLSLWNAASAGMTADGVLEALNEYSRYPIPQNIDFDIREYISRYGRLRLVREGEELILEVADPLLEQFPQACWLTVGDGRFGRDAHYIESKCVRVVASDISDVLLAKA